MRKVALAIITGGIVATVLAAAPVAQAQPGCTNDRGTKTCTTTIEGQPHQKWSEEITIEVKGSPKSSHEPTLEDVTNLNPNGFAPPGAN
jgi:hypothetical protein